MLNKTLFFIFLILVVGFSNIAAQEEPAAGGKPVPKMVSGGVLNGKATNLVKPDYPAAARAVKASGAVNVQVTIDEDGNVTSAAAVSGHPLLRAAAVQAARASKFSPTRLNGQPVKVTGVIVYNFTAEVSTEFKEPFWALGLLVSIAQNIEPGLLEEMNGKAAEWDTLLKDLSKDVPEEFAPQQELFAKLGTTKDEDRRQAARALSISLRNQLQGHKLWQYELGENLGVIVIETLKFGLGEQGKDYRMDEVALRSSLENVKKSTTAIPAVVSPEFSETVRRIATFANTPDFKDRDKMYELFTSLKPLFEAFGEIDE